MPTAHARPKGLTSASQGSARSNAPSEVSPEHRAVLELQRLAGNDAVSQLLDPVQRAAVKPATATQFKDYRELLDGFQDLAASALSKGGKTLDTVHFGTDMSPTHHGLLEQVRGVLILAQDASADSKATAAAHWPGLATKLQKSLGEAEQAGVAYEEIATVADFIPLVGENYVGVRHAGPAEAESFEDYSDLVVGIDQLLKAVSDVDKSHGGAAINEPEVVQKHRAALSAVPFGGHLSRRHRDLLTNLRTSLVLANTEARGEADAALKLWQGIQGDLRHVLRRAKNFMGNDLDPMQKDLNRVGREVIHGAVYTEALKGARGHLESPDLALELEPLQDAIDEFAALEKLAEKTQKLTQQGTEHITQDVINEVLGGSQHKLSTSISGNHETPNWGKAILELVKGPGEIKEKWEALKKQGGLPAVVTGAELASKIHSFVSAGCDLYLGMVKTVAEQQVKRLAEVGGEELKHWAEVAEKTEKRIKVLEKVGNIAIGVTVVIGYVKFVDAIWHRQWGKAFKVGLETSADVIGGFAAGMGGAAMVGGIEVIIAAEAEALKGAVAMKEWCEKGAIREAAWDFVDECTGALHAGAEEFVGNVKLLSDPSVKSEWPHIEKELESYQKVWLRSMGELSDQFASDRTVRLGGQPGLRGALGYEGALILQNPGSWVGSWESTVHQMQVMFAGASRMAQYVVEHYPKKEKKEKPKEGEEEGEE